MDTLIVNCRVKPTPNEENQRAHHLLDELHVPRLCGKRMLDLPGRISWLNGQLTAARFVAGCVRDARKVRAS